MRPQLNVIGAATSAGAYGPGQELAPAAFREHGLLDALMSTGWTVTDVGDVARATYRGDAIPPEARDIDTVAAQCRSVADAVADSFAADSHALVLGGDCTVEVGTVAGALRDGATVCLVYIDLDADLNTPATGDGVLDWMGVAHLLGVAGADQRLATLTGTGPMLPPRAVRLVATDSITTPERAVIDNLEIHVEPLAEVLASAHDVVSRIRRWAETYDRLLLHVDVDVLDYSKFPIAENTGLRGGLDLETLTSLLAGLCEVPNWSALTITEINPAHAPDARRSFEQLIVMLATALRGASTTTRPRVD